MGNQNSTMIVAEPPRLLQIAMSRGSSSLCNFLSFVVDAFKSLNHKGHEGTQRRHVTSVEFSLVTKVLNQCKNSTRDCQSNKYRDRLFVVPSKKSQDVVPIAH